MAHLHSQIESGEVLKQNAEYGLAKANKELAAERRLVLERDNANAETTSSLQRTLILINFR